MVPRLAESHLRGLASRWPIVTLTGPRQAGKSTLCKALFPQHSYLTLESPDVRQYAASDPRGLLSEHREGIILDEIQRAPELMSYLQEEVDRDPTPGRFILTGSANLALHEGVTQSLAGRTAMATLLPMALAELRAFPVPPGDLFSTLWNGGYPAIFDRGVPAGEWLRSYAATYVERDVRQVLNVGDLSSFQTFLRLAAGRGGQLLNLSRLGADCGISHNTAKAWLSVLETGFIAYRLRPWWTNLGKREVKTPKLYFYDSGLVCALLGIRSPGELVHHPLRGSIFEGWVVGEVLKARFAAGEEPGVFFYRNAMGLEADLIVDRGSSLVVADMKSGATLAHDFFTTLDRVAQDLSGSPGREVREKLVIYGGEQFQRRSAGDALPWSEIGGRSWS